MEILLGMGNACWVIFRESAVYMLFGFFFAGLLYVLLRPEQVARYLGRKKFRSVLLAALFGVPIPLCSCGVIPAAAGLKRQGASRGATLSFLISTPESGIDSMAITWALMDPIMTVIRPLAAFFTAMTAGLLENRFGKPDSPKLMVLNACGCDGSCSVGGSTSAVLGSCRESWVQKGKRALRYAFLELLGDIGPWFLGGVIVAGLITYWVPDGFFVDSGNRLVSMLVMIAAGLPLYVCATASTPIAAALILKGLNPGAALVFLLVGPATNMASMSMVTGLLGKRSLGIYLAAIVSCALILGVATDAIYDHLGIVPRAVAGQAAQIVPHGLELTAALILAGLLAYNLLKPYLYKNTRDCGTPSCARQ
jgi:uncharacterized membrane protein YraQ (UPF0718 family)